MIFRSLIISLCIIGYVPLLWAHHVLGRPTYSLSENTTTPPSVQIETQIGKYFVTVMAFPAFPRANEAGRIHLYGQRIDGKGSLEVPITFKVHDDNWFAGNAEMLGTQSPLENIYKQAFEFNKDGDYIITADFNADGEPYTIDFPLTIGKPLPIGTIGFFASLIFIALISVNLLQRRRMQRMQTERHHEEVTPP